LNLRVRVFFLTFLLFAVPLFGHRALAQSAELGQSTTASETQRDVQTGLEVVGGESGQATEAPAVIGTQEQINESNTSSAGGKKVSPKDAVAMPCLRDLGVVDCILTYGFRVIEFHAIGEEVIARFQRLDGTVNDADVIVMSSHIEDAALNDRINLDESPVIFAQFQQLSGARYEIPKTANEVKRSLGFSEETPIAPVDWLEILKVHLERTLSTTPMVSDLISDLLGVELNPVVIEAN
jgi:hypothetical protein